MTAKSKGQSVIPGIAVRGAVFSAAPLGVRGRSGPVWGDGVRRRANFGRCSSEIVILFCSAKGGTTYFHFLRTPVVGGTQRSGPLRPLDEGGTRRSGFL